MIFQNSAEGVSDRRRASRRLAVCAAVATLALVIAGGSGSARAAAPGTTCSGGTISSGTYLALTVTGWCAVSDGAVVNVVGGLTVGSTGSLDASSCSAQIAVSGGVAVEPGGLLNLGGSLHSGCSGNTDTVVTGGIAADHPTALVVHGSSITGGVVVAGSGSAPVCGVGHFVAVEDSQVSGGMSILGLDSCWFGLARDQISGTVRLDGNTFLDPDAMEILSNSINGKLECLGNSPVATNIFDAPGPSEPNTVTGAETGECVGL
jgi:hypothetical protein